MAAVIYYNFMSCKISAYYNLIKVGFRESLDHSAGNNLFVLVVRACILIMMPRNLHRSHIIAHFQKRSNKAARQISVINKFVAVEACYPVCLMLLDCFLIHKRHERLFAKRNRFVLIDGQFKSFIL